MAGVVELAHGAEFSGYFVGRAGVVFPCSAEAFDEFGVALAFFRFFQAGLFQ